MIARSCPRSLTRADYPYCSSLKNIRGPTRRRGPLFHKTANLYVLWDDRCIINQFPEFLQVLTEGLTAMKKVACYVDGFNLYHAINETKNNRLKWLNLNLLARTFLRADEKIYRVCYFTALMIWDREKSQRHKEYIAALKSVEVECIISKFQKTNKHCQSAQKYCNFYEEKQTDVAVSARIISDCIVNNIDRVILITADSDQVPTVATIRGLQPQISILVAAPPGRIKIAKELCHVAHESREISIGRLEKCLFPRNVLDGSGKIIARSPSKYQPARLP